uniref:BTB domain-containing protein n=1 Tax=Acrobeloides nanus TaxID=290746 RepID=A0A914D2D6_9BILA
MSLSNLEELKGSYADDEEDTSYKLMEEDDEDDTSCEFIEQFIEQFLSNDEEDVIPNKEMKISKLDKSTNVKILVGSDQVTFVANKIEISQKSTIMSHHLYGPSCSITEKPDNELDEIRFPYLDPNGFSNVFNFWHDNCFEISIDNVIATYKTANIFAVNALEESCIEFITEHLKENNENALKFLDQEGDTTTIIPYICLQYIDTRTLKSEQFLNISYGTFCLILREKECDEIEHINAMHRWAANKCIEMGLLPDRENLLDILGDAKNFIRFPLSWSYKIEPFIKVAVESGILNRDDLTRRGYSELYEKVFPCASKESDQTRVKEEWNVMDCREDETPCTSLTEKVIVNEQ